MQYPWFKLNTLQFLRIESSCNRWLYIGKQIMLCLPHHFEPRIDHTHWNIDVGPWNMSGFVLVFFIVHVYMYMAILWFQADVRCINNMIRTLNLSCRKKYMTVCRSSLKCHYQTKQNRKQTISLISNTLILSRMTISYTWWELMSSLMS